MINVVAVITTKPGQRDAFLEAFRANVPNVRAEVGCIEYGGTVDVEPALKVQTEFGPDTVVVIEKWETVESLEAHFSAPHMVAYSSKTKDLVLSRVLHVLGPA